MDRWAGRGALSAFAAFTVAFVTQFARRYRRRRVKTKASTEERMQWYKDKMRKKQKERRQRKRELKHKEWAELKRQDPEAFERQKAAAKAQWRDELAQKKEKKILRNQRLTEALETGPMLILDLHARKTTEKERSKAIRQLGFMHSFNRKLERPWAMVLTSCDESYDDALKKHDADKWHGVKRFQGSMVDACASWSRLDGSKFVYLSPDSPNTLEEVKDDEAYIIGSIIDISVEKYASLKRADALGVRHARLPLKEFGPPGMFTVLNLNHVFELLQRYKECKDWSVAIRDVLPDRNVRRLPGQSARAVRKKRSKERKSQAGGDALPSQQCIDTHVRRHPPPGTSYGLGKSSSTRRRLEMKRRSC